jgi:hypothetical protein
VLHDERQNTLNGKYSYWLDGSFMTGHQRVRLNAAARRLRKLEG